MRLGQTKVRPRLKAVGAGDSQNRLLNARCGACFAGNNGAIVVDERGRLELELPFISGEDERVGVVREWCGFYQTLVM